MFELSQVHVKEHICLIQSLNGAQLEYVGQFINLHALNEECGDQ